MRLRALIGAGVLLATGLVLVPPQPTAIAAVRCGEERWPVKTLSDRAARRVNYHARHRNIDFLRHLPRPDIGFSSPRQRPYEFRTYTVRARLRAFVIEDDRDIHLIVSRPHHRNHKMITELPSVHCKGPAGSIRRHAMHRARRRLVDACGSASSSFRTLHGVAKIKGVAFFDLAHGQSGAAPNYIELHPLLRFRMIRGGCRGGSGGGGGGGNCDPSYPDFCIPPPPPDLDCGDISRNNFTVIGDDPHGFDVDGDGVGCEA